MLSFIQIYIYKKKLASTNKNIWLRFFIDIPGRHRPIQVHAKFFFITCNLQLTQPWVHRDQLHRRGRDIKPFNVAIVKYLRVVLVQQSRCPLLVPETDKLLKSVVLSVKKQRGIDQEVDLESMDEASVPGEGMCALWRFAGHVDDSDFAPHVRVEECVPASTDLAAGLDVLGRQVAGDQE